MADFDLSGNSYGARIYFLALALCLVFTTSVQAADVTAEFNQVADSLHLEMKGQPQWDYNMDRVEDKKGVTYKLEVPRMSEASSQDIIKLKSPMVDKIEIRHEGSDGRDLLTIHLKDKGMEAFDYLTDQPSRLIVDFFKTKKNAVKNLSNVDSPGDAKSKRKYPKKPGAIAQTEKTEIDRKPSSADFLAVNDAGPIAAENSQGESSAPDQTSGIFDGGDPNFERFKVKDYEIKEEAMIAAGENYYIKFPMLKVDDQELEKIRAAQPIYEIAPKGDEENKQARLLQTLFQNQRYNVFLKAVSWFNQKYPNSKYDEIIRFMWADAYFALWTKERDLKDFDMAMLRYRQAIEKYPKSALVERTMLLMGFASLDRGDFLGTLRLFQQHVRSRPKSPNRDISQLAIAQSYANLSKFDEAEKQYSEIESQGSARKYQMDAAFRIGDVQYLRHDYAKAIETYQKFLKKYPEGMTEYPNAYYNQAGAYFEIKKPRDSLNTYLEFLKRFPAHPYAGYGMTRVGEILEMLGVDKSRVMGAYLETYFRYGDNPSSIVARLRLLSSRMSAMKDKEIDKAVKDILELAKKSPLEKIEQFATVLVAEGYSNRKDFTKSIGILTKFYQKNPTTADTQLLRNRIVRDINAKIRLEVDQGKFMQALASHAEFFPQWIKGSDRIDTNYQVARAYEQAGNSAEAEKLYRDTLNRMLALKGTPAEKERNVYEKLPTVDELQLRLAVNAENLNQDVQAYEYMKNIKAPELLSDVNQIERIKLAAQLLEKKGDLNSATRYLMELVRSWKGIPELVADPLLQLAQMEIRGNQKEEALKSLQKIDQLNSDSQGNVPADIHATALQKIGDLQLELGQTEAAASTYQNLLDKYSNKIPLASYRYQLGKIYFKKGDLGKANEAWTPLKTDKNEIWYKLAQEQLKNSNWNQDYKKYIKRIPAMSAKE